MTDVETACRTESSAIERQRRVIIERYGEWTAHNIHLAGDVYTIGPQAGSGRLRRTVQVVADLAGKPLDQLRVLDLACLEGMYALEFARHGAEAVGIEGREANLAKANFAKEVLSLDNLTFYQDDIRNLSPEKYGQFDVVLCLGVYYHLDAPSAFRLAEQMYAVCRRLLFMDTQVGVYDRHRYDYNGHSYWGVSVTEYAPEATHDQQQADLWGSIGNNSSVWLTRPSLLNLFAHVGFTSVYECHNPSEVGKPADRLTLAAIKGQHQPLRTTPEADATPLLDWPEHSPPNINPQQRRFYSLSKRLTHFVPRPVRQGLKAVFRSVGLKKRPVAPWEWDEPFKRRKHTGA
jgi:2-polyprenyl-3-methyl-5-hydroxy-6-metoxy-1,4-benzoquinol methylase